MKKNTQKLLLALFRQHDAGSFQLDTTTCRKLTTLTTSGFRSVVHSLEQRELLTVTRLDTSYLQLTPAAIDLVQARFPAVSAKWQHWDGSWSMVLFLRSSKADRQFRRLRSLLVASDFQQVSRGAYIFPGELPVKIESELKSLYADAVVVCSVNQWRFGHNPQQFYLQNNAEAVFAAYSSISKRLSDLLIQKNIKKSLTDSQKGQLFSDFDIFWETIATDLGFFQYFFPNKIGAEQVLTQFQELFLLDI